MDLSIPEVMVRKRIILEGYLDFSNSVTSWDIYKNMLRKSSEMFVYCQKKKALICPTPRRRGIKEDGCIIAYNTGYILSIGENEETCTEYIGWLRKKFRQHDPSVPLKMKQLNFIFRVDIPSKIGFINLSKLYNNIVSTNHNFEILYDPEIYTAIIINFQSNCELENNKKNYINFPDESIEDNENNIENCCYIIGTNYIVIHHVKDNDQAIEAVQILIRYLNKNDMIIQNCEINNL